MTNNATPNDIGVVIIGRNEGERLKKCISSVLSSTDKMVYVDSHSTDGSIEFVKSNNLNIVELNKNTKVNASKARNEGFKWITKHYPNVKYIHFIDADCELDQNWLAIATKTLDENGNIAVVCGRLREKNITQSIYTRLCDMSWYINPGEVDSCGGISTIRKTTYEKLGGYDESLIAGADPEFYSRVRKNNQKILCLNTPMGTHDSAMIQFKQWWTRSVKTGYGFANAAKWGGWHNLVKSIYIWAVIIPISIILLTFLKPIYGMVLALIYPLQVLRISFKLELPYGVEDKLLYGFFIMVSKFPQLIGIIKYYFQRSKHKENSIIEYKAK